MEMSSDLKLKKKLLLGDLGKATRRGIRSCPQCGTLNGTRGLSCKNSLCDMVFKEIIDKPRRVNLDACKIITDQSSSCLSWATTFSVRVKERCPEHLRGFVQIEYEDVNNEESSNATPNPILLQLESVDLTPSKGTCYVGGCAKRNQPVKLSENDACVHVTACVSQRDQVESQPFTVKHSILNSMCISPDWKQTIWLKARRDGPLVQRVARSCMVVKCDKEDDFPLGYLHTSFLSSSTSDNSSGRFGCTCTLTGSLNASNQQNKKKNASIVALNSPEMYASNSPEVKARCIHFYSCMAAFSSEHILAKEFTRFISDEQVVSSMQQVIAILGEDGSNIKVEVLEGDNSDLFSLPADVVITSKNGSDLDSAFEIEMESITPDDILGPLKLKESSSEAQRSNFSLESSTDGTRVNNPAAYPLLTALDWLAGVTERINVTMHYGFSGQPEPLVFSTVPQHFFNFLMERISAGSRKKRLPNSTQAFVQKQVLPTGTFTRYTWLLTNVLHVKQVFDTPLVALEVSRKFTKAADGTFKLVANESCENNGTPNKKAKLIRPLEFKTFLKVGQMSSDPRNVTPFTIEYVPDILPKSKIGEMRIKFEYGHQRNGQVVSNVTDDPT